MKRVKRVRCASGLMGWQCTLRDNYGSFDAFKAWCELYLVHKRVGFKTPEDAWKNNPILRGSVNPSDLRVVIPRKRRISKMKKSQSKAALALFSEEQRPLILALLMIIGNDGHTVYDPSILSSFPAPLQKRFTSRIKSDGTPKGTLFDCEGNIIRSIKAVSGLRLLTSICGDLGISYESKIGRGSQAGVCTFVIRKHFDALPKTTDLAA